MLLWERKSHRTEGTVRPWLTEIRIPYLFRRYHEQVNIQLIWMVFIKSQGLNSMRKMIHHWVSG